MNLFLLIVFASTGTAAVLLASTVEFVSHRKLITAIAGAIGGGLGQKLGRWISGKLLEPNGMWLSNLEFERIYRLHYIYSQLILFGAIFFGFLLGVAVNYLVQLWLATGLSETK